jgi:hypothetical protein
MPSDKHRVYIDAIKGEKVVILLEKSFDNERDARSFFDSLEPEPGCVMTWEHTPAPVRLKFGHTLQLDTEIVDQKRQMEEFP